MGRVQVQELNGDSCKEGQLTEAGVLPVGIGAMLPKQADGKILGC